MNEHFTKVDYMKAYQQNVVHIQKLHIKSNTNIEIICHIHDCVSPGYHNKIPQTGWLKQQKCICLTSGNQKSKIKSKINSVLHEKRPESLSTKTGSTEKCIFLTPGLKKASVSLCLYMNFPQCMYLVRETEITFWSLFLQRQ